jgi:hypothetical protein
VSLMGREAIAFGVNLRSAIGRGLYELDYHEMPTLHKKTWNVRSLAQGGYALQWIHAAHS